MLIGPGSLFETFAADVDFEVAREVGGDNALGDGEVGFHGENDVDVIGPDEGGKFFPAVACHLAGDGVSDAGVADEEGCGDVEGKRAGLNGERADERNQRQNQKDHDGIDCGPGIRTVIFANRLRKEQLKCDERNETKADAEEHRVDHDALAVTEAKQPDAAVGVGDLLGSEGEFELESRFFQESLG